MSRSVHLALPGLWEPRASNYLEGGNVVAVICLDGDAGEKTIDHPQHRATEREGLQGSYSALREGG